MTEEQVAISLIVGALTFTLLYTTANFGNLLGISHNPHLILSFVYAFLVSGVTYKSLAKRQ
ncbi:MAG: hypothetical protein V1921_09305 [Candidatus Altiarchaeota archaeon]